MKETKYITIGTPIISNDIFRNILRPLDNLVLNQPEVFGHQNSIYHMEKYVRGLITY